jgi:hypothetical protein
MRLDKLFRTTTDVELPGGRTVSVRVLSDPDIRVRDDMSQRAYRRVARAFRNEESEEYINNVAPLDDASDDSLRSLLVALHSVAVRHEAVREFRPAVIPEPEGATPDEKIEVEDKRDAEDERVQKERIAHIEGRLNKYRKSLKELDPKALLDRAKAGISAPFSTDAADEEFMCWTIHLSTDGAFEVEDVRNMHPAIKDKLMEAYLEVDRIDPFDLH